MDSPNVVIRTRLVQLAMLTPFILPLYWFIFVLIFSSSHFTIEFKVSSTMISVALLMIGLEFLSESEVARIESDRIVFKFRRPILFAQIKSFSFDDGLTLKIRGAFFAFMFQSPKNREGHQRFVKDFRAALAEWQEHRLAKGMSVPRQKHFYGTWKAKLSAVVVIFAYTSFVALSLEFRTGYLNMIFIMPVAIFIVLFLLLSSRTE